MGAFFDVTALGELLVDLPGHGRSEQGNPLFEACPGGAPCNVLAMLRRLGHACAFVGKVGDDLFGRFLRSAVEAVGIDTRGLVMDAAVPTTLAFVLTQPNGDRDFSFLRDPGADMMLTEAELSPAPLEHCRIFHFGTLSMTHPGVRRATERGVEIARQHGAWVSFDPNLRPLLWRNLADAKDAIAWGISHCDILKISDNELEFLTGTADIPAGAAQLQQCFPNLRVLNVTAGASGSYSFSPDAPPIYVPACACGGVIDTTGAGDTFCACVLHFVLAHGLDGLTPPVREAMLRFANTAAYLVTTRKGALRAMPTPEEIQACLAATPL